MSNHEMELSTTLFISADTRYSLNKNEKFYIRGPIEQKLFKREVKK